LQQVYGHTAEKTRYATPTLTATVAWEGKLKKELSTASRKKNSRVFMRVEL